MGQWRRGITVLIYCWILCVALGRAALVDATLLQIEARSDCPVIQFNCISIPPARIKIVRTFPKIRGLKAYRLRAHRIS